MEKYIGTRESILIVDDVEAQRNIATDLLKKLNYSVISVPSGKQAVDKNDNALFHFPSRL